MFNLGRLRRRGKIGERGLALIGSYLLLTVVLAYTNLATMHTVTQRMVAERTRESYQALDLANGAMAQFTDELHRFMSNQVPLVLSPGTGDVMPILDWLDALGTQTEFPVFDPDGDGERDATVDHPRTATVPAIPGSARTWIRSVARREDPNNPGQPDPDPLAPRRVRVRSQATVGSTTKVIEASYEIAPGPSDIFRYAYFVNNYGWFDLDSDGELTINGEVRSNGNLAFGGNLLETYVNGDLYASVNPELDDPALPGMQPADGSITGDPSQALEAWGWVSGSDNRYNERNAHARPARRLVNPARVQTPELPTLLPPGHGWDTESPVFPEQRRLTAQPVHPMPYLGDLELYKQLAIARGGYVSYYDPGADGRLKTSDDVRRTINAVYTGPTADPIDDAAPVVLYGTSSNPIVINGPVVIPGDVIIKGYVTGRGTIYAGRNVHIIGMIKYKKPTYYPFLYREATTGELVANEGYSVSGMTDGQYDYDEVGRICGDGTYIPPISPTEPAPPCP